MKTIQQIRQLAKNEEVDYLFLMNCLSSYKKPRNKIGSFLKKGELIRVKKGLYVFGKEYRKRPYSLEVLANLIYGPSYVSFEYALSYYNLIPEAVVRVTSACSKRVKLFKTPVGEFVYSFVPREKFPVGITWESIDENTHFFIAKKEKALADYLAKLKAFQNPKDLLEYLIEGMRIEHEKIFEFNIALVEDIANVYQNKNVNYLCQLLKK